MDNDLTPEEQLVKDPDGFFAGRGLAMRYVTDEISTSGIECLWDEQDVPRCNGDCPQYRFATCDVDGAHVWEGDGVCEPCVRAMAAELKRVLVHDDDRR